MLIRASQVPSSTLTALLTDKEALVAVLLRHVLPETIFQKVSLRHGSNSGGHEKGRTGQVQCAAAENGKVVTCREGLYRLDTPGAGTEGAVSGVKCSLRKSLHSVR